MTMLVGTRPEARAVDYFTTPPNTLEFENVVFPRYPGFVTLPSGVQVKELCVGDGAVATASTRESLELKVRIWTVHQGRSAGGTRVRFVPGDGAVIHGIEQAVLAGGGMRVGGTRRALVPPKASVSWPYVSLSEDEAASKYKVRVRARVRSFAGSANAAHVGDRAGARAFRPGGEGLAGLRDA
jgi:hypothetical protein